MYLALLKANLVDVVILFSILDIILKATINKSILEIYFNNEVVLRK